MEVKEMIANFLRSIETVKGFGGLKASSVLITSKQENLYCGHIRGHS